jgi:hypothetical protein
MRQDIYHIYRIRKKTFTTLSCMLFPRSSNPMTTAPVDLHRPLCRASFDFTLRTLSDSAHSLSAGTEGVGIPEEPRRLVRCHCTL